MEIIKTYGVLTTIKVVKETIMPFSKIIDFMHLSFMEIDFLQKQHIDFVNFMCKTPDLSKEAEEEIFLYWGGSKQHIPNNDDMFSYFNYQGLEVIENIHPGILTHSMNKLTEKKLIKIGIPKNIKIVLTSKKEDLFHSTSSVSSPMSFCGISIISNRNTYKRVLDFFTFGREYFDSEYAFFLKKKKK